MSDEPERLFSRADNTLDEGRIQLLPETVQALECIKSWTLQKIDNEGITESRQLDEEVMQLHLNNSVFPCILSLVLSNPSPAKL
jgi:hypothetical protein